MAEIELTSMVMIHDLATDQVVVQDRVKTWCGLSFPGGHIENGESFADCAIREIKEETGLDIFNLKSCGIIHWYNNQNHDRHIVFLYKTTDFSGELFPETDEGKNCWMDVEELKKKPSENGFDKYMIMFFEEKYSEAFGSWNDDNPWELIYK
jgi:8-oxo-dGTP diphosphatase